MDEKLSAKEAYLAMYSLLDELYSKYQFDQLGGLLGSMSLLPDGTPADQAMWNDWIKCVEKSKTNQIDAALRFESHTEDRGDR